MLWKTVDGNKQTEKALAAVCLDWVVAKMEKIQIQAVVDY